MKKYKIGGEQVFLIGLSIVLIIICFSIHILFVRLTQLEDTFIQYLQNNKQVQERSTPDIPRVIDPGEGIYEN
jgi:hypothetical protein